MIDNWLTHFPNDFKQPELVERMSALVTRLKDAPLSSNIPLGLKEEFTRSISNLREHLKLAKRQHKYAMAQHTIIRHMFYQTPYDIAHYVLSNLDEKKFPKPQLKKGKSGKSSELSLEKLEPVETARQLTLIDHYLLKRIKSAEFFNVGWEKRNKDTDAPNIVNFIARFNQVTGWVATEIVSRKAPKARATVIEFFVDVAQVSFNIFF